MNIQTESTEDKIISATFRLIRKDGIDKVTTKKIAAEAGVNEVTIFRKFNNEEGFSVFVSCNLLYQQST